MRVTRYIGVWNYTKTWTPDGRNNQDILEPVSPALCSWAGWDASYGQGRRGRIPPWILGHEQLRWRSWALVALGTSTGRAASRVSEGLSSVVSLELVLHEAPILWPHDMKNWLNGKDPDVGKDWITPRVISLFRKEEHRHRWSRGLRSENSCSKF